MRAIRIGVVLVCVLASGLCFATPNSGTVTLADGREMGYMAQGLAAPNYEWWYGCSPTSAGMMMGFYDRNGYGGLQYPDLVPGGVAEMNSFGAGVGPLAKAAIASQGHIDNFYANGYGAIGDDVAPPHHEFNCLADFMGTSQDSVNSSNGSTWFWYWNSGARFFAKDALAQGVWSQDGMYGVGEYVENAGYDYANKGLANEMLYSQLTRDIYKYGGGFSGFTFADFEAEIDAGRPVIVQIEGHSMLGYDYIDATSQIKVYDTWAPNGQNPGIMTWNGVYSSMEMYGVMVFEPSGGTVPEPATLGLLALGGVTLIVRGYRRRRLAK